MDTDCSGRGTCGRRRVSATILLVETGVARSPTRGRRQRSDQETVGGKSMIAAPDTEAVRG